VPVCWPQFSDLGPLSQQHGFARNAEWSLLSQSADASGAAVELELRDDDASRAAGWPHAFSLRLRVALSARGELSQRLHVSNAGDDAFAFTAALHTYLRVAHLQGASVASVHGLEGAQYLDSLQGRLRCSHPSEPLLFASETDRIYLSVLGADEHGAPRALRLRETAAGGAALRSVRVEAEGLCDAVLWNPWVAKAAAMADFGDEEYASMVCIEAAVIQPVTLGPGKSWSGEQQLALEE
jgi:glucose-6-phosphate 1-epimerase